ncbi:MAG TPA: hypothetical protein VL728_06635 [Cyclobacteriaceae bacterium]|jgi:deoxycytidine triphosphate deaminase|nr:hypothetical protein [Cyclobacteriaceae bacterium]
MATLSKQEIIAYLNRGELIKNPRKLADGSFDVEPASYDLTAGIVLWKEVKNGDDKGPIKTLRYRSGRELSEQPSVTLQPGQMAFVITLEEILMPVKLAGTVYSRNQLSRDGILALNAGHIDPGFNGPIVIRLINLRNTTYTVRLGAPIYSIVFSSLVYSDEKSLEVHRHISMDESLVKATESANASLSNALHDPKLSVDFIRVEFGDPGSYLRTEDFGKAFVAYLKKNLWKVVWITITSLFTIVVFLSTVIPALPSIVAWFKKLIN